MTAVIGGTPSPWRSLYTIDAVTPYGSSADQLESDMETSQAMGALPVETASRSS